MAMFFLGAIIGAGVLFTFLLGMGWIKIEFY